MITPQVLGQLSVCEFLVSLSGAKVDTECLLVLKVSEQNWPGDRSDYYCAVVSLR